MPKKSSGKAKKPRFPAVYKSRYTDSLVTAPQYISELICEKMAHKREITLPYKFWELDAWKKTFLSQILAANGLLKIYRPDAVIKALQSSRAYFIYSLRAPQLDELIKVEEKILEAAEKIQEPVLVLSSTTELPRKQAKKDSLRNKLK